MNVEKPETAVHHLAVLVRASPDSWQADRAALKVGRMAERATAPILVFFHGPGVMSAAVEDSVWVPIAHSGSVCLQVCEASWQRRCIEPPLAPFGLSSLVQFWHRAVDAEIVMSFGSDDGR
ncbi:MAG: DsrE family protein [Wenzhouxiangella sp.]